MALADIVAYKKGLILEKRAAINAYCHTLSASTKSLEKALRQEKAALICEIKPASPSKGVIRDQVNPVDIARIYSGFADAISVLADEKFFSGSLNNVLSVSNAESQPVLCKDIVVSPLQIFEARFFGAHAVLLMLSVLTDEDYLACAKVASDLKMDFITEVHTEEEMKRAIKLGANIIGINNRDLKTLRVDLATTERLRPLAPKDTIIISESGIASRSDMKHLRQFADGFLVGTSLMSAERIDLALRELLFGRVKICGITNQKDAQLAYDHGAYYGGINFSALSKRRVNLVDALNLKKDIPLVWGGVFVNQPINEIQDIAKSLSLDFVQLHGDETDGYVNGLRRGLVPTCEIWRAVRVKGHIGITSGIADRNLLDTHSVNDYGGTGKSFDWNMLKRDQQRKNYVIAGGVNAENIQALSELEPFAIDIASGVEDEDADPRRKSEKKLTAIFNKLRL